jgi:hypothetical protein
MKHADLIVFLSLRDETSAAVRREVRTESSGKTNREAGSKSAMGATAAEGTGSVVGAQRSATAEDSKNSSSSYSAKDEKTTVYGITENRGLFLSVMDPQSGNWFFTFRAGPGKTAKDTADSLVNQLKERFPKRRP